MEQAKLKNAPKALSLQGKIALVTGAASGIGKACVELLHAQGACVVAADISKEISEMYLGKKSVHGFRCDLTNPMDVKVAVQVCIMMYGGLDFVVSNAGTFPPSENIADLKSETWEKSLAVNLTSHQMLLKEAVPFLKLGLDPTVIVGSPMIHAKSNLVVGKSKYLVVEACEYRRSFHFPITDFNWPVIEALIEKLT